MVRLSACFFLIAYGFIASSQPIVRNPSFEELDEGGAPVKWGAAVWGVQGVDPESICTVAESDDAPSGNYVAQIAPERPVYSAWAQRVEGLHAGRWYEASALVRCERLEGQGCHLNVEYWPGGIGFGSVDAEHLVGTHDWTRQTARFIAPGPDYHCNISLFQIGGPGTAQFDDVTVRAIEPPVYDLTRRRVLDGPFWGMFTCYARYLHMYGEMMRDAGVHWQRQGLSAIAPEQQAIAEKLGMRFAMCIDGMPPADDPGDPCYPVTNSQAYLEFLGPYLEKAGPSIAAWEFFNEPNTHLGWTLPGYANLIRIVGRAIKQRHPEALIATGGFAPPEIGYAEACLKRDADGIIDLVLLHPYAVDEALDSALYAVADACGRAGRPDVAVAINETGWPTWDPATGCEAYDKFVPEDRQAEDIVKLHIQAIAHRLSFVTLLNWNDFTEKSDHSRNMGIIRIDGSKKPSYRAYTFMTGAIGDRRVADWSYSEDGTRVYLFTGQPPVWVTWNALRDAEVTIDVGDQRVFPCDVYGAKLTSLPQAGEVTLRINRAPRYLVAVSE